jgi:hypothetical protein
MLYIERDGEGRIIAMHGTPKSNASEEKTVVDDEIIDFLNKAANADSRKLLLSLSDMGIIRLVEDLIDLLIQKNVILYTDLSEHAQEKIRQRKRLREAINSQTLTVDDII